MVSGQLLTYCSAIYLEVLVAFSKPYNMLSLSLSSLPFVCYGTKIQQRRWKNIMEEEEGRESENEEKIKGFLKKIKYIYIYY